MTSAWKASWPRRALPTMGGIMILGSIFIAVLLFGNLTNMYIQLLLITLVWLGALGFADDYIKVFKKNKEGMSGKYKILGQVILALTVGITICVHEDTVSTLTTIPFVKDNEFDYAWLAPGSGKIKELLQVVIYVAVIIFIITAMSNATNLTDGMDGLAAALRPLSALQWAYWHTFPATSSMLTTSTSCTSLTPARL